MSAVRILKRGKVYRHYKTRHRYEVLALAKDTNVDERWVVVYRDIDAKLGDLDVYVRTYEHFFEQLPDGTRRFTPLEDA